MPTTRRVTFSTNVHVKEILSIYDFTTVEISAAWFDEQEMEKITQRCFKILHKVESTKSKNSIKYCMRGLESHTTLGSITKKRNRTSAYKAVLDEQERHWNNAEHTRTHAISEAYCRTSSSCLMWAQVIGNRDEQAVAQYLCEEQGDDDYFDECPIERVVSQTTYSQISTPCSRTRKIIGSSDALSVISPKSVAIF